MAYRKLIFSFAAIIILAAPFALAQTTGGSITGSVTDPKGALIVDATVTVVDAAGGQSLTATTDRQGHYKIVNVPAGSYTVTITARGFNSLQRDEVKIEEGKIATLDARLALAPIETESVTVTASGAKANSDAVYQQLRRAGNNPDAFNGSVATVNNLVLKRDAATFTLRNGEIYFLAPVENRTTSAVFIGDGELTLTPPTDIEKKSLAIFTDSPTLTEQFTHLVLRFTDKTFDEIKASSNASLRSGGAQAARARSLYEGSTYLLRKQLKYNMDLRTLADIYAPQRPGFFNAFIGGRRFSKLLFQLDPLGIPEVAPEKIAVISYGDTDGGIWTAFYLADEYRTGIANSNQDNRLVDITHHEIDGAIRGTQIGASDVISLRALVPGTRVLPFSLFQSLQVSRVQDEAGRDLAFIQESKDEDADFAVILPQALETGKTYKLTVQYKGGDALRDSGGGNFFLIPRSTWYPNAYNSGAFGDRATFDMTFRFPKGNTFVGTGAPVAPDTREGDVAVAKWTSGNTELAVAGFNYGRFKKRELADKQTGYGLEFYANEEVPDSVKEAQHAIEDAERRGVQTYTTLGTVSTTKMADSALTDAENATRIYSAYFGKLPYTRLAMTQQPAGNFGQAWPTLIFMPFTAFIDTTQRSQLLGQRSGTSNFWRYVAPHELAHQWWGHVIGWTSYHDQWMSEGFAEFSASLYVQFVRRDLTKFIEFWEDQRKLITTASPATKGRKPYTVGPVTQGYRLNSAKTGSIARAMIYPKGAYILHMVRMMMRNHGNDKEFEAMMHDFIQTYFNKDVSTEDFKRIVEKHMTPEMDLDGNKRMDWFFNQWVYGTEMPAYKLDYTISGNNISGRITQSGVPKDFQMVVPIYVDFGNGWVKIGSATMIGENAVEIKDVPLPQPPKRVAICALNDVLATSIENNKR